MKTHQKTLIKFDRVPELEGKDLLVSVLKLSVREDDAIYVYQASAEREDGTYGDLGTYWNADEAAKSCLEAVEEGFVAEKWSVIESKVHGDRPDGLQAKSNKGGVTPGIGITLAELPQSQSNVMLEKIEKEVMELIQTHAPQTFKQLKKGLMQKCTDLSEETITSGLEVVLEGLADSERLWKSSRSVYKNVVY